MRLAQLARSLDQKTFDVREALSKKFEIDFEKGPNTKLDDEHIAYVKELFAKPEPDNSTAPEEIAGEVIPDLVIEADKSDDKSTSTPSPQVNSSGDLQSKTVAELKKLAKENGISGFSKMKKADLIDSLQESKPPKETEPVKATPEKIDLTEIKRKEGVTTVEDILGRPEPEFPDLPKPEEAETIRAPKIELEGITVVDKIDLPEPPKKEENEKENSEPKDKQDSKPRRKKDNPSRNQSQRQERNKSQKQKESRKPRKKEPVNKAPSKQELQRKKLEESYKPKQKQVKGKKKKTAKKKAASEKAQIEAQEIQQQQEEIKNPKKTMIGKFWWWLTNG